MKIRMLVPLVILGELRQVGEELDLADAPAQHLVNHGRAEAVKTKEKRAKPGNDGPTV